MRSSGNLIRRSVSIQYFLSFFLILLLSVVVSSFSGHKSIEMLNDECRRSNALRASQFACLIDELLENANSSLLQLEKDYDFVYTVYSDQRRQPLEYHQLYRVRDLLALSKQASQLDMFIYYKNNDIVLSAEHSKAGSDLYYQVYYSQGMQSFEEWMSLMDDERNSHLGPVYHEGAHCLALVRTLPTSRMRTSSIVAVSVFRENAFKSFMQDAISVKGAIAIYDAEDNRVLYASDDLAKQLHLPEILPQDGYLTVEYEGQPYYVSVIPSRTSLCRYVSITPIDVLMTSVTQTRRFQLLVSTTLLALGLIFSVYLTRRNARPIKEAVKMASERTCSRWNRRTQNELDYLKSIIENTLDEKQYIQQAFDLRNASFQQTFLYDAVYGKLDPSADIFTLFRRNHLPLISNRFAIVLLRGWHEEPIPPAVIKILIDYTIKINALCHPLYLTSPSCTCVLNIPKGTTLEELDELCSRFRMVHAYTMCRSDIFTGMDGLSKAFEQVRMLAELDVVYDNTIVLTPALIKNAQADFTFFSTFHATAESELTRAIQTGENMDGLMDRLRLAFSSDGVRLPRSVRCFMFDMRRVLSAVITRQCSSAFATSLNIVSMFFTCESYVKFSAQVMTLLARAHAYYVENSANNTLCVQVLSYLDTHYADSTLGVGTLDKMFGVSSAILSERFRTHTSQSIGDYLTHVRIAHARQLLSETDRTLEEIAESVGIVGSSTLIRLFKKVEGTTPGAYRRAHQGIQTIQ